MPEIYTCKYCVNDVGSFQEYDFEKNQRPKSPEIIRTMQHIIKIIILTTTGFN
jgi:hypothetical protein